MINARENIMHDSKSIRGYRGLLIHTVVFVLVQCHLFLLHFAHDRPWTGWAASGWLIALGAHAAVVLTRPRTHP